VSVGEVQNRGAAWVRLARGRALALSGRQWRDKGAGHTGSSLFNSGNGRHGTTRWLCGALLDKMGQPGSGYELAVEQGEKRVCSGVFAVVAGAVQGTRGQQRRA